MKKLFLLFLVLFSSVKACEIGSSYDKRLFSNDIKEVQEAINERAELNAKNNNGTTALIYAAKNNRLEIAKLLIASGAELNAKNKYGSTALIIAIKRNNSELAKLLIDAGANLNIQNNYGSTALRIAQFMDNIEVAKLIKDRMTYYFINAAQEGKVKELKQMIEQGININAQDENGFTALMRASQAFLWSTPPYSKEIKDELQRKLEIIKILLDKKADLSLKDNIMHYTALRWAQESGNKEAEKLFHDFKVEFAFMAE